MTVEDEIKTTVEELLKVLSMKNVIGEPIDMGDKVVITVTKVGVGFGAGSGEAKGEKGGGEGGGAGGAAGVSPVAAIVILKNTPGPEGVKILPLTPPSGIGRAIGDIASVVADRMAATTAGKEAKKGPPTELQMQQQQQK